MDAHSLELSFPGTLVGFEEAFTQLRGALDNADLSPGTRYNVELVFEEIVANIVRHGCQPDRKVIVSVTLEVGRESVILTFCDDGVPFDPRDRIDPPPAKSLEEAPIGGRGLMFVRHAATAFDYCRTSDQHNRFVVTLACAR